LLIAQLEREQIAERTSNALQYKIRKGERMGRVRYGYDVAPDGKTLVPNQREQEAIELMIQWHKAGMTLRGIAEELSDMGIPTKDGKPWGHTAVRLILKRVEVAPPLRPCNQTCVSYQHAVEVRSPLADRRIDTWMNHCNRVLRS
jgi:hypothetical protein